MVLTAFQTKKMTHMFKLYDANSDGTIGESDYERRAQILTEQRGYAVDSLEYQGIRQRIMKDWEQISLFVDTNADGLITLVEFLEYSDYVLADAGMWHESSVDTAQFMIESCDIDGDGKINLKEYSIFFKSYDLDDDKIKFAFEKLDVDGDGLITVEEITAALDQFGNSENPDDAGNQLFGPLA